jgi:hypothetical protein
MGTRGRRFDDEDEDDDEDDSEIGNRQSKIVNASGPMHRGRFGVAYEDALEEGGGHGAP